MKQPRYTQCFEYMFIFSKGAPKTFNPIMIRTKSAGQVRNGPIRQISKGQAVRKVKSITINEQMTDYNVWDITISQNKTDHPAVYPLELAKKHILSWSNEGDLVFDPFLGSGTTGIAAKLLDREFVGTEIDKEYFEIARARIDNAFGNYDAKEPDDDKNKLF